MALPPASQQLWASALEAGIGGSGTCSSVELASRVAETKVLCVGAGGIGCELLKTLVLSGFRMIDVIDMDTIDVSNLNRQFLFRARHVGQPKASVAAAAAAALAPEDVEIGGEGGTGGCHGDSTCDNGEGQGAAASVAPTKIPKARITPHRGDVRSSDYGASFFGQFDLILNGLDNVAARRHVNRLALAAGAPLVESGTAGHLGQVTVHFKGLRDGLTLRQQREAKAKAKAQEQQQQQPQQLQGEDDEGKERTSGPTISTECYECSAKPTPKSFPVCTIRSTPEKPIHCVVWAKELMFSRLVGPPDAASDLEKGGEEEEGGGEEGEEGGAGGGGGGRKEDKKPSLLRAEGEPLASYASRVYSRLFDDDVRDAAALDELWESRPRPVPLPLEAALLSSLPRAGEKDAPPSASSSSSLAAAVEKIEKAVADRASSTSPFSPTSFSAARALGFANDHARWAVSSWAALFVAALVAFHRLRPSDVGAAAFDKDDRLAVELVSAGAALRAAAYRIGGGERGGGSVAPRPSPPITVFEAKGMAGNIVHALATTNAVVAGLIVAEALKLVAGAVASCRVTWIRSAGGGEGGGGGRLLVAGAPPEPAAGCAVCGSARLELECDPRAFTLSELVNDVLKGRLALIAPTLICGAGFYWEDPSPSNGECDLDDDEVEQYSRLLPAALASLPGGGLAAGTVVAVKDQAQAIDLHLLIVQKKEGEEESDGEEKKKEEGKEEEAKFVLRGAAPAAAAAAAEEEKKDKAASPSSSSGLEILPDAEGGGEEVAAAAATTIEPEIPDAVDAAGALAAEEARKGKEKEAAAAAVAAAAAATEEPAAAEEEQQQEEEEKQQRDEEEQQPSPEPPSKRPRRAAAEKGRETVREAMRENAKGGRGGRKRKTK